MLIDRRSERSFALRSLGFGAEHTSTFSDYAPNELVDAEEYPLLCRLVIGDWTQDRLQYVVKDRSKGAQLFPRAVCMNLASGVLRKGGNSANGFLELQETGSLGVVIDVVN